MKSRAVSFTVEWEVSVAIVAHFMLQYLFYKEKQMLYSECWFLTKGQMYCWGKGLSLFYKNRCYRVVFLSIYEYQPLFQLLFCKVVVWIISLLLLRPWCLSVFSLSSCSVTGLATQLHGFAEEPSRCVFFFWTMGCRCFFVVFTSIHRPVKRQGRRAKRGEDLNQCDTRFEEERFKNGQCEKEWERKWAVTPWFLFVFIPGGVTTQWRVRRQEQVCLNTGWALTGF